MIHVVCLADFASLSQILFLRRPELNLCAEVSAC